VSTAYIKKLIKGGESERVEFKASFGDEAIETAVAFANCAGGTVIIGINDNGEVKGVALSGETIQQWVNETKSKTQPSILPSFIVHTIQSKSVVEMSVQEFPVKPVSFRGRFYKRFNRSNHLLSSIQIAELNMQSLQVSWDAQPVMTASTKDLDDEAIEKFISRVNERERFKLIGTPYDCLEKLKLIQKGKPTQAALLLFGSLNPLCHIHIGRFKTPSVIVDDRSIVAPLFDAAEQAMKFIVASIKVAFEISDESVRRKEVYEYPLTALREILLNTIVHRDYRTSSDIQIKIFDNSISFFNPGGLYGGLSVEDLQSDNYPSHTRNKLIAEAFYLTGDIEKYGSGFIRIREAISTYPTMKFEYRESGGGFFVQLSYLKQKTTNEEHLANTATGDEGIDEGLNEGLKSLLAAIQQNPGSNAHSLAVLLENRPLKTIERQIAQLKKLQMIARNGSRKTGGYVFAAEGTYQKQKPGTMEVTAPPVSRSEGINEGLNEGISEGISEGIKAILSVLRNQPGMQTAGISAWLNNRPRKTIERQLALLKRRKLIEYRGSRKTGGYFLTRSNN
jgi:ATP-dependent DNA helicase RecG